LITFSERSTEIEDIYLLYFAGWVFINVLVGMGCASVANHKNRDGGIWIIVGLLGGVIALIVLAVLPALEAEDNPE
jgi:hypothetical protein